MPSKRPSTPAMDEATAAAERLRASASRSKKRSSRSKSRSRDRRRAASPNPNPSPRRDRQPRGRGRDREREGERGAAAGSAPSRKSDRKRRTRSFPDSTTLATAMASAASASRGGGQKLWSDADEVALLKGAIAFKARTGFAPRLPDMVDLFESLRGSVAPHLDQAKVYYKLKRLKSKFQHSAPGANSSRHELRVRDLSADLWGAELAAPIENNADAEEEEEVEEEVEEGDAVERYTGGDVIVAARMPIVSEVLGDYWRLNGRALSGVSLEKGLAQLGLEEAESAEAKWRRQLEAEMRTQMRRQDLGKEVFGLLMDAVKGLGP
ncbi:hypothetical protein ACP4OV_016921 [Aristida adscensionis]